MGVDAAHPRRGVAGRGGPYAHQALRHAFIHRGRGRGGRDNALSRLRCHDARRRGSLSRVWLVLRGSGSELIPPETIMTPETEPIPEPVPAPIAFVPRTPAAPAMTDRAMWFE